MDSVQRIKFDVLTAGENVAFQETIQLTGKEKLTGIMVTGSNGCAVFESVFNKLHLNSEEIFPPDYDAGLLMFGVNIQPKNRFFPLEIKCKSNFQIDLIYKDCVKSMKFEPYIVSIYFRFEIPTE